MAVEMEEELERIEFLVVKRYEATVQMRIGRKTTEVLRLLGFMSLLNR